MKYLLVLLVVVVVAWVMLGRGRGRGRGDTRRAAKDSPAAKPGAATPSDGAGAAQAMIACSHCGLHLPRAEAVADAQGRLFCDDAHRLAGPR